MSNTRFRTRRLALAGLIAAIYAAATLLLYRPVLAAWSAAPHE